MALAKYGFKVGEGLYTDMNAIKKGRGFGQPSFHICGPMGLGIGD